MPNSFEMTSLLKICLEGFVADLFCRQVYLQQKKEIYLAKTILNCFNGNLKQIFLF